MAQKGKRPAAPGAVLEKIDRVLETVHDEDSGSLADEKIHTLRRPLELKDGTTIVRIRFANVHAGQLRAMDKHTGEVAKGFALVARMARGLDASDEEHPIGFAGVEALHPADYAVCQEICGDFFGPLLSTGSES